MKILYGVLSIATLAHFQIARFLLEKFPEAELEFLPSTISMRRTISMFPERQEMLEILCRKLGARARVNSFEHPRQILWHLAYPEAFSGFLVVIGTDNLASLPT